MKAQSAVEYLMTYGWSILIIAVVIASLVELRVFNSVNSSPSSCIGVTGYSCSNPTLYSSGSLITKIGQVSTGPITITGTACTKNSTVTSITPVSSTQVQSEQQAQIVFHCPLVSNTTGSQFTGHLWIEYSTASQQDIIQEVGVVQTPVVNSNTTAYKPPFIAMVMIDPTPQIDAGQSYDNLGVGVTSGGIAPFTYKWYEHVPGSSTGTLVSTQTLSTGSSTYNLITTPSSPAGYYEFSVNVTDSSPSPEVQTVGGGTVIVNNDPTVTISPSYSGVIAGNTDTLTANGVGGTALCGDCLNYPYYEYQWYYDYGSGNTPITGATSNTFAFSNSIVGFYDLSVSITDGAGLTANSPEAIVDNMAAT